jgi:hypothetical protein
MYVVRHSLANSICSRGESNPLIRNRPETGRIVHIGREGGQQGGVGGGRMSKGYVQEPSRSAVSKQELLAQPLLPPLLRLLLLLLLLLHRRERNSL